MGDLTYKLKVLRQIGLLSVQPPHRLVKAGVKLATWGPGFPAAVLAAAARHPQQLAIIDDAGELTWKQLSEEINRTTQGLKDRGVGVGDSVAVLCRNHRHMVVAMVSVMQLGGKILLLNTMASAGQLGELTRREGAEMVVLDQEFLKVADELDRDLVVVAWEDDDTHGLPTLAQIAEGKSSADHKKPAKPGGIVIFTSGTTGMPKGANRKEPENLDPLMTFFGAIPYRGNSTVVIAAPLFHSWGLINFGFGLSTVPTYVLRRKFKAEQVLADIDQHKAEALVVVPLMMQRLVDADPTAIEKADVSSLRITASSGSALAGELATRFMDTFTDSVYNFYGATETGWVSIASPEDLRAAPGTAGRVPWRTVVKVLDADGQEVPPGETGVIHVGNEMQFAGYTDGNTKNFADGLMHSGDLGYFDADGRLFVAGRDDDMIVSGGENVFPRELEDALIDHPRISDVVVTGIPDPDWGHSLAAYVVVKGSEPLPEDEIVAYAKERVARFAVPRKIAFLDELPRNPTGKVMKRELPEFE
ncbi:AMP-binding enzyme [Aeromicrobium marinum DSM 15272]|uniref:AMP-binding enzyme n=1 Tax=Aeromicrobium marinum DSM 15272 TaxID=585531 RepID=E2SDF3_9ACTN|nr:AMP-binding protein [Aeromicrobium marinum]EFQ82530.1 AMP-binding enzyme [Aeromicrobium marinum DSM 15272]